MDKTFLLYKGAWITKMQPHRQTKSTKSLICSTLDRGGYFLRDEYDFDCEEETSYWYVIKDNFGGLEELSSNCRHHVRKAIRTYSYKRVSAQQIMDLGYEVVTSAQSAYRVRTHIFTREEWEIMIRGVAETGKADFWMAFETSTNLPVALSINILYNDCCNYSTLKCNPIYMHNSTYPYYGLIYEMNRYYLEECGLRYVNDGARSITEHSNIQPFLIEKFNFRKAYCRLDIHYQPWFGLIVKMLYPFRRMIKHPKVRAILNQEAMARGAY